MGYAKAATLLLLLNSWSPLLGAEAAPGYYCCDDGTKVSHSRCSAPVLSPVPMASSPSHPCFALIVC